MTQPDLSLDQLKKQAIQAALDEDWQKAIQLNQQILSESPEDIATLNRIGFAQMRQGELKKAKEIYTQVLELDKFNPIAKKSLDRLKKLSSTSIKKGNGVAQPKTNKSFIEEPGKTKTIALVKPADGKTIASLHTGTVVQLTSKKRKVVVELTDGGYIGCLPDDISQRMSKLLKAGYTYSACIKSSDQKNVSVFIREESRGSSLKNIPTFVSSGAGFQVAEIDKRLIDDIPVDTRETGEDDD